MDRIGEKLIEAFEIPKDALLDLPRIVIIGDSELVIENHLGILEYRRDFVRIATARGEVAIEGEGLSISRILRREVSLEGRIRRVELNRD